MSKSTVDSDGFQLVVSKKYSKKKQYKIPEKNKIVNKEEPNIDIQKAQRNILSAVEDLQDSAYLKNIRKAVSTTLQSESVIEIVSFGLGHIGECVISRYQLALLLCLKDIFRVKKVLVHDPIFFQSECNILRHFEIGIITENNEGSYVIPKDCVTLMFLPHCPKQLTNNFMWCNWGKDLANCILVCNSFSSLIENHLTRIIVETVPYIYKIFPYTQEITLSNNFKYTDIFNDISVHTFPKQKLAELGFEFWVKGEKPQYQEDEEFITSLVIDKLRI